MVGLVIVILSTLLSIITGIAVLRLNWRRATNFLYGLTSVAFILLGVANYMSTLYVGNEKLTYARIVNAFTAVALVFTYYLVIALVHRPRIFKRFFGRLAVSKIVVGAWTGLMAALCMTPWVISKADGAKVIFGPGILLFAIHMSVFSFGVMGVLIATLLSQSANKQTKGQAKFLLIGFLPIVFIAPLTGVFLPAVRGDFRFISITPAYSAFFVLMISYAMVRFRLFDIRPYVVRAAVYAMTSLILAAVYIAPVVYVVGYVLFGLEVALTKFIIGVLIATVAAYNFNRLRMLFDARTSKFFFRDAYDSALLLGNLNRRLVSTIDLEKALYDSADLITSNIKSEYCVFYLEGNGVIAPRLLGTDVKKISQLDFSKLSSIVKNPADGVVVTDYLPSEQKQLKSLLLRNDAAVLIELTNSADAAANLMGYMIVGYKKNGNDYTGQDVKTLQSIADVLVIAIQNAMHFEEIQKFNVTLQRRVNDATAQLRRTNAKLVTLDETKDDFISMASHQLRTPLTSVKGYLSMVLEEDAGKVTPMQRKMLDQAFVSSQRMVFLIADLLNVSRLKTGKFIIEPSRVNLAKVVDEEVNQLRETAKGRSLELQYDRPEAFPDLMLDETKIRQVVMNFIDNAIYYTPAGGKITVELVDTPVSVKLFVRDSGIGVPKSEQPHLFTKFYRAGNARRARPDGTGLGLFMAKKVVVASGGAVIFESREGKGSIFGFVFAKQKVAVPAAPKPRAAGKAAVGQQQG